MTDPLRDLTDNSRLAAQWFTDNVPKLAVGAGKIAFILVLAVAVRYLTHHAIDRLTQAEPGERVRLLGRPLRERARDPRGPLVFERRAQRAKTIGSVLKSLTSFAVYGVAAMLVLGELGINLAPIIASAGIVGVAIGFGAQNLVKDFISGVFMMLEDQYGVGDVVDLGPASGTIEAVGLRVTTVRDVNGTLWYVRNGTVQRVGNSSQGFAVAVVDIPLSYSVNIQRASLVLARVAEEVTGDERNARDVLEPAQVLGVEKVTTDAVTLRVTVKVRPGRQWAVQRALRAGIMAALDEVTDQAPTVEDPATTDTAVPGGTTTAAAIAGEPDDPAPPKPHAAGGDHAAESATPREPDDHRPASGDSRQSAMADNHRSAPSDT